MKNWKLLFWLCIVVLIVSNVFWLYTTIDNAVGRSYYEVSCNEFSKDRNRFKILVDSKKTKDKLLEFLTDNNIHFNGFEKGKNYVVSFSSFSVTFDEDGNMLKNKK